MYLLKKHHLKFFFLAWFLLSLLQAASTELFDDEAYYWVYSKFPAWGYFDHPPMIALLIKTGYYFFKNELGVRLLIVILNTLTLAIIYGLLPKKNDFLFYAIACSLAVLQIGGILAVPDVPLVFFAALFFLSYKNFIREMSLGNTFILGLVMALMLYTKYHGILVIVFTFLSNPRLALKPRFYLAALTGIILFAPHLYWQYSNGFPSVLYHLVERNAAEYSLSFTAEYVFGQILLAGPLMGWLLLWAAFRYKTEDLFERALKFSMLGIYIFFLASTIKGRVEANWTVAALIPLMILSHQYLINNYRWQRIVIRSVWINILLVVILRLYMALDIAPIENFSKDEFHKNKPWAATIYKKTKGLPVTFIDSYQMASKYWFYSGVPAFSLNTPVYRRNNFNYWPIENSFYGKRIAALSPDDYSYYHDSIFTALGTTGMRIVDSFYSFSKVKIIAPRILQAVNGKISDCRLQVLTEKSCLFYFQTNRLRSLPLSLIITEEDQITHELSTGIVLSDIKKQNQTFLINFPVKLAKGQYNACFSVPASLVVNPSLNSRFFLLKVQ